MGKDKSSLKNSIVAIFFVIAAVFTFVQVTSAQPAVDPGSALTAAGPAQDSCRVALEIQGAGSIATVDSRGQERLLTAVSDELSAACGPIELTAVPDPLSRFVSWQGVPAEQQYKHTISVDGAAGITAVFAERQILRYEPLDEPFIDHAGQLVTEVPIMESAWRSLTADETATAAPVIDVWYGSPQSFGQIGTPQRWVNVLGNVSDADGDLKKLEYSLNGGDPVTLSVGGDGHKGDGLRLYRQGDFNIDLDKADLIDGSNSVLITATDDVTSSTSLVTVNYDAGNTWPLPYSINWSGASSLQNVAQVVDGDWGYTAAGVRPKPGQTGYDRIIDLGDMTWDDFEMTVPVTVHGIDTNGFGGQQVAPAIGLVMRWQGHTILPDLCDQPLCGYLPVGATSWYAFDSPSSENGQFSMWVTPGAKTFDPTNLSLTWGETYYWKVRSESVPGTKGRFKMKVWPASAGLGGEPADWMVSINGTSNSLQNGSALLLSHHVDVTFGNVTVVPINAGEGPPDISNIEVIPEPFGATVRWLTDEPADSRVDYGPTSAYGKTVSAIDDLTEHSLYLPGLNPQKEYHFKITSKDADNESSSTKDQIFNTQGLIPLVSDDFNECALAPDWTFYDFLEDGSYELNGSQLEISVPAGTAHDIWPSPGLPVNRAPHLMYPVTDPNNLKVKFDSGVAVDRVLQGILVEQDDQNFLRINYQYQDSKLKLFVIGYKTGTSPDIIKNITVNGASSSGPLYLLLTREGGQWQVGYSTDGDSWSEVGLFTFPLSVASAGVFAGNYNKTVGNEPAFTAVVDYYFDADAPIDPEDADPLMLPVQIVGSGSVAKDPICGNPVTLTAEADPGWHFVEWRGDPIHGLTSLVVTAPFEAGDEVAAMFEIGEPQKYILVVQTNGDGTVIQEPDKVEYIAGESVALTAVPDDGWLFESWEGAITGTGPRHSVLMDDHKVVTANFIQDQFTLDVTVDGPGQVQVSPQGPYSHGDKVTLTAVPVGKYASFLGWSGAVESSDNPLEV